ncbi:MAG: CoA-binding protein [Pseudomonadota bacterium]
MGDNTTDDELIRILRETQVIAVVGASLDPTRPSNDVTRFLVQMGYRVIPVNPTVAGATLHGAKIVASLAEAAEADMVDIFRRSEAVGEVVEDALVHLPRLKTIWMQLGVRNAVAARTAEAQGVTVVQDRCPKIEYPRLRL